MKTLVILAVILGILFLYFVVKAEKSIVIRGGDVMPSGIDIPKLILDKVKGIKPQVLSNQLLGNNNGLIGSSGLGGSGQGLINDITTNVEDLVSKAIDKISGLIKNPIENKVNDILCPKK